MEYIIALAKRIKRHDTIGMSAQAAYYLLLSIFPLALLLLSILSIRSIQLPPMLVPPSVMELLDQTAQSAASVKFSAFSLILLTWSASTSIWSLMQGVSLVYNSDSANPTRGLRRARVRALFFTLLLALLTCACASVSFFLEAFNEAFMFFIILLFIFSLYVLVPGSGIAPLGMLPGAVFASLGWIGVSRGFEIYMKSFNNYSVLYGGIGAFLGLALWLYVISFILFLGAEINCLIYSSSM